MSKTGVYAVLVGCVLINVLFTLDQPSYLYNNHFPDSAVIIVNVTIGLALLFFPLIGFLADVRFTRYQMMKASFAILSTTLILFFIVEIMVYVVLQEILLCSILKHVLVTYAIFVVFIIVGIGLFEANAIQFGMDQLLEASSTQLSQFIHWYFWFMHLGQPGVYCMLLVSLLAVATFPNPHINTEEEYLVISTTINLLLLLWLSCLLLAAYLYHQDKKHMYVAKVGTNPFKCMWEVLSFAWRHKYPLNRSAFTYCEENAPSRLDLGKEQYGGPFKTEEVEDVKTFLRLLLLLVSLFGYHVAGDGFFVAEHMQFYSCPNSLVVWGILVYNPGFVSSIVVLISIPTTWFLPNIHRFTPNLLKRIGIGMLMMVLQDFVYIALSSLPVISNKEAMCIPNATFSPSDYCLYNTHTKLLIVSHHFSPDCVVFNNAFLWLILPQVFNGLGQLLVNMTVLEFLCAQAPRSLHGLLIGLWYAMFSI